MLYAKNQVSKGVIPSGPYRAHPTVKCTLSGLNSCEYSFYHEDSYTFYPYTDEQEIKGIRINHFGKYGKKDTAKMAFAVNTSSYSFLVTTLLDDWLI